MANLPLDSGVSRRGVCYALMAVMVLAASAAWAQAPTPGPMPMAPPLPDLPEHPMLSAPVPMAKAAEEMVVDVQIEGNRAIGREKILPHIRTRAGRPYDTETIEEDVRRLNKTRLFVTVKPLSKLVVGGRQVIFQVVERPVLQEVKIIGNEYVLTKPLKKELDLKVGDAADPFAVEEGRRRLEEFYHKRGYSKVRVSVFEGNKPGDLRAIYLINEGPKQRVLWVSFIGNQIVSGARLQAAVVKSAPPILYLFKGEVDRKQIDEDCDRLIAYYRGLGFFQARVGRELQFNENQNWLSLTFIIDEGPRSSIRNVSVVGNTKFSGEQLSEKLKLKQGQFFNQAQMLADSTSIQDKYGSVGYVFADIKPETRFLEQPGQVDLVYTVSEGDRYRVGRVNVEIKGENPHTRITTVLNRMSLKPGDIVDTRELRSSERRLKASGLFLVDPTKGAVPKIVFTPPELDDKDKGTEVAGRPRRQTSFYRSTPVDRNGQPLPPLPPGERYADVVLQYENRADFEADQQSTFAPAAGDRGPGTEYRGETGERPSDSYRIPTGQQGYPVPTGPQGYPIPAGQQGYPVPAGQQGGASDARLPYAPVPSPDFGCLPPPDGPVEPMETPLVVRGQYTVEGASAAPDFPARRAPQNYAPATQGYAPAPAAQNYTQAPAAAGQAYPPQGYTPAQQGYAPAPVARPVAMQAPGGAVYQQVPPPAAAPNYPADAVPNPAWGQQNGNPAMAPNNVVAPSPSNGPAWQGNAAPMNGPAVPAPIADPQMSAPPQPGVVVPPPGQAGPREHIFGDTTDWLNPSANGEPLRDLPLTVRADETQTGRLMFGVGVNSDAGVVGSIVLDEQNFDWQRPPSSWDEIRAGTAWRGAGQRFRIEAVPGTQVQRYMVSFQEPYLMDSQVSLGLSGYYFDRIYTEWRENRVGGRISLGYQFTHDFTGSVAFRGMNVNVSNPIAPNLPDLAEVVGNNGLYGFGLTLAHDTRDNTFLATEGHLLEIQFEQVVGKFQYPHTEIELSQYFKLYERPDGSGRHVLSLTGKFGVSGDDTPIFERYYAGGFSTLRGFRFRGVSPRQFSPADGVTVATGGDFELLGTIQYLFPITADDMLRGVVFCDTGTVTSSIKNWDQNYRVAPGFGVRLVIPAMGPAPIALDFAFPVAKQDGDQTEIFSFFVGLNR